MPTRNEIGLPQPISSDEFENIVCDFFTNKYQISFQKWGRKGQCQKGLDLIGGKIGVQCKAYHRKKLTVSILKNDIEMVEKSYPQINKLYFVTTADKDTNLQTFVLQRKGNLEVEIYYWDVIERFLLQNAQIMRLYYPEDIVKGYTIGNSDILNMSKRNIKNNQKEEYLKIWKSILFLNRGKEDVPITLEDVYVVPDYFRCTRENGKLRADIPLNEKIYQFVNNDNKRAMIIYGSPGIGKSSLVNFIAGHEDELNNYRRKFIYIGIQYLNGEIIQEYGLLKAILKFLECEEEGLENSVVILDGLDEIQSNINVNTVLAPLINQLTRLKFKILITSRDNVIDYFSLGERVMLLELKPFDDERIKQFHDKYEKYKETKFSIADISRQNKDVMGIPLILYFAHALDLKVNEASDKCRLYNELFNGIYDKCRIEYLDLTDNRQRETNWGMPLLVELPEKMKEDFRLIAKLIATMIFKTERENQDETVINQMLEERTDIDDVSKRKYPISNFYQISNNKIKFIHRSFYEYFIAQYIFDIIDTNLNAKNFPISSLI